MKDDDAQGEVIRYWMEKASEALESAGSEQAAGRLQRLPAEV